MRIEDSVRQSAYFGFHRTKQIVLEAHVGRRRPRSAGSSPWMTPEASGLTIGAVASRRYVIASARNPQYRGANVRRQRSFRSSARCFRSSTRPAWPSSPRNWRGSGSSWSRPAARQADRRHRRGGARHFRPDRLSRDDGRAGEDAAPQGAWRPAGGARQCRASRRRWTRTGSAPSISSWSISIRSRRPSRKGASYDETIENIDIGGPAMIRSAAKNHAYVTRGRRSRRL